MARKRKLHSSSQVEGEAEPPQQQPPSPDYYQPEEYDPQPQFEAEPEQELDQMIQDKNEEEEEQVQGNMNQDENVNNNGVEEKDDQEVKEEGGDGEAVKNDTALTEQASAEANGGEEEEYVEEPVEKLIEPFGKEQLVLLVKEAISKHPDLMESVQKLADADPAHRKIFVHGLGWDTTAETLISVFEKYGEIEDCKAVVDKISGKSKGYAFILFKHRVGAKKALQQPQKKIGTRVTSCQLASAGPVPAPPPTAPPVSEYTQRKIFVSNVSADVDPKKLVEFFSQFGEIEEGPLGIDKQSGKFRGFCLFVYKSFDSARKALEKPHKPFEGTTLHCQKAVDGPKHSKPFQQQQQHYLHNFRKEKRPYAGGGHYGGGPGGHHTMPPPGPASFNSAAAAPALAPALGQALTALLAPQGLGALVNQGAQQGMNNHGGYNQQHSVGYGTQPGMQGGYPNPQMGGAPLGGPPYMGHGR